MINNDRVSDSKFLIRNSERPRFWDRFPDEIMLSIIFKFLSPGDVFLSSIEVVRFGNTCKSARLLAQRYLGEQPPFSLDKKYRIYARMPQRCVNSILTKEQRSMHLNILFMRLVIEDFKEKNTFDEEIYQELRTELQSMEVFYKKGFNQKLKLKIEDILSRHFGECREVVDSFFDPNKSLMQNLVKARKEMERIYSFPIVGSMVKAIDSPYLITMRSVLREFNLQNVLNIARNFNPEEFAALTNDLLCTNSLIIGEDILKEFADKFIHDPFSKRIDRALKEHGIRTNNNSAFAPLQKVWSQANMILNQRIRDIGEINFNRPFSEAIRGGSQIIFEEVRDVIYKAAASQVPWS